MNSTTIRDLLRLVLPASSQLITPAEGLHHHVGFAISLRATLPAFPRLRGGELALISVAQARILDERLTLPTIVRRLAEARVAAIAVVGEVDDEALKAALNADLPLLRLPDDADLRTVERDVQRLLVEPDLQYERRAAQLYSELTQQVAIGQGAEAIVRLTAERTDRAVGLLNADGEVRIQRGPHLICSVFNVLRPPLPPSQTLMN